MKRGAKAMYRVRKLDPNLMDDLDMLQRLHMRLFKGCDMPVFYRGCWWLLECLAGKGWETAGFAGMQPSASEDRGAYLVRAGVLPSHRGRGLQQRLIRVREKFAREKKYKVLTTDTSSDNFVSSNNLIASGFRVYWPKKPWGEKHTVYWRKELR